MATLKRLLLFIVFQIFLVLWLGFFPFGGQQVAQPVVPIASPTGAATGAPTPTPFPAAVSAALMKLERNCSRLRPATDRPCGGRNICRNAVTGAIELPPEVDEAFYIENHPDVAMFCDKSAFYRLVGENRGDYCSPAQMIRGQIMGLVEKFPALKCLEIAPFYTPVIRSPGVKYYDIIDREEQIRCKQNDPFIRHLPDESIPFIHFVSPTGNFSAVVQERFELVFSSHSLEHQPDLIRHLKEIAHALEPGGVYVAAIPDKRYCFDHYRPLTTPADILQAHVDKRVNHVLRDVVEARAHNNASRHWAGDHGQPRKQEIELFENWTKVPYYDTHALKTYPRRFRELIDIGTHYFPMPLTLERVYGTLRGHQEFVAVFRKSRQQY